MNIMTKDMNSITMTELVENLKNGQTVTQGTKVFINMHDLIKIDEEYTTNIFEHIPTGTKVIVKYEDDTDWSRISIVLPGYNDSEAIWIGDEIEGNWLNATIPNGSICAFEMELFEEIC